MRAVPYKCYHCKGILGVTTSTVLYVGAIRHKMHVTFECGLCEKMTFWKPDDEKLKGNK